MNSIKTKIDLNKLAEIAEITKPARTGKGWKVRLEPYEEQLKQAFKMYISFLQNLVEEHFVGYNRFTHVIKPYRILFSYAALTLLNNILLPYYYLQYAPALGEYLKDDEAILFEDCIGLRSDENANR
jgi:hypothetical protein